jgi:uncharacterized protein DUF6745
VPAPVQDGGRASRAAGGRLRGALDDPFTGAPGGCTLPGSRSFVLLRTAPESTRIAQLDLRGCSGIRELGPGIEVTSWLDVADSGLSGLPPGARVARLRWRGVPVEARVAFRPQTVTADEVLATPNVELRRVLLERMGYERFLADAGATVLDADHDPGGPRQLLTVPLKEDEPLVCVAVCCPSIGRRYVIRVPPHTRTCRQAAAWIAGFDDPDAYHPIAET